MSDFTPTSQDPRQAAPVGTAPLLTDDPPTYVPAIIGTKLTEDGTVMKRSGEVLIDFWHLGLTVDRKQLVLRSADGYRLVDLPARVTGLTEKFLRDAFAEAGIPPSDDVAISKCTVGIRKTVKSDATFRDASTVKPRRVQFLYRPYLPLRKATLMAGDGGVGKSVVTCDWAATVSNGGTFPTGWKSMNGEPGNVLIMSAEDTAEEILQPRLAAAGAHLSRITLRDFDLSADFVLDDDGVDQIERQMAEKSPKLVIIDPIVSFMGDEIDMHRSNQVRPMMVKLAALARDYDAAILVIAHINKNESAKAGNRVGGTVDFRNAARSLLLVGDVDDEPERGKAIFHDKHNYSEEGDPLGYETVGAGEHGDVAKVVWIDTALTKSEVFGGGKKKGPSQESVVANIAAAFLKTVPGRKADSRAVRSVIEAALPNVNDRTVDRGRKRAGIETVRDSTGRTEWQLPESALDIDES